MNRADSQSPCTPTLAFRIRMTPFFLCAVLTALTVLILPTSAAAKVEKKSDEPAVGYEDAVKDLNELKGLIKSKKSKNDEIVTYLDLLGKAYVNLKKPATIEDDADEEAKKAFKSAMASFEKNAGKFRSDAEKLLTKSLKLVKTKGSINERNDVNIKAAQVLGSLAPALEEKGRKSLSKSIRAIVEKNFQKAKHDMDTDLLNATFGALGELKDIDSLDWMAENFTHSNEVEKEFLIAAQSAMRKFAANEVPGKVRYAICKQMITTYAGVEAQAEQNSSDQKVQAKKRFWDDIKTYTIPAVQHFTNNPVDEEDEPIATMAGFQKWWRKHKRPGDVVWKGDKKKKKKK